MLPLPLSLFIYLKIFFILYVSIGCEENMKRNSIVYFHDIDDNVYTICPSWCLYTGTYACIYTNLRLILMIYIQLWQLMAFLLLRHALPVADADGDDEDPSAFFSVIFNICYALSTSICFS